MENEASGAAGLGYKPPQTASLSRDEITRVYNKYERMAKFVLKKLGVRDHEAEDILHDGFVQLMKGGHEVRDGKAYLFKTLHNLVKSRGRREAIWDRNRERIRPADDIGHSIEPVLNDDEHALVRRALAGLVPADREPLILWGCGFSGNEMADMLGVSGTKRADSVYQRVCRAKQSLKNALEALGMTR